MDNQTQSDQHQKKDRALRQILIGLIVLIWIVGLCVGYYVYHKPFTFTFTATLVGSIASILTAVMIILSAGGIGLFIEKFSDLPDLIAALLQVILGLGVEGLAVLVIGVSIGLSPFILIIFTVGIYGMFWKQIRKWFQHLLIGFKSILPEGKLESVVWIYLGLIGIFTLVVALAPPVKFDALMYHLMLPNAYLEVKRVAYLPWMMMSGMPQQAEMLFTWAIGLAGNSAATCLTWLFGMTAIVGIAGFGSFRFNRKVGLVSAVFLFSGFSLATSLSWGYIEWLIFLFGLAFLICMDRWRELQSPRYLIYAGIFTGFAIGTKYTNGILLLCGAIIILIQHWKKPKLLVRNLLIFGGASLLVSLPWWIKNGLTTGNPFYPLFFPSGAMTAQRVSLYDQSPPWGDWRDAILLPIRATLLGVEGADGYSLSIGPLLFGFAIVAGIKYALTERKWVSSIANLTIITGAGVLIWAIGNRISGYLIQTRLFISIFPPITMLAGIGFVEIPIRIGFSKVRFHHIFSVLVALVLTINLIEVGIDTIQRTSLQYLANAETRDEFLGKNLGWYYPAMQAINSLPAGSKTLLLYETRSLYCLPKCRPDEILDRWQSAISEHSGIDEIIQSWKTEGFNHVLIYTAGAEFLKLAKDPHRIPGEFDALNELEMSLPAPVNFGSLYSLYTLP